MSAFTVAPLTAAPGRVLGLFAVCALASAGCSGVEESTDGSTPVATTAQAKINLGPTLRVGWMGMAGHVGTGPGGDTGNPIYKVVQWNPHAEGLANVPGVIALADQKDILLLAYTPGSPGNFGQGTPGGFSLALYKQQLDELAAIPEFNDAVARGRIHCYIGDEPNLPAWNGTWTPARVDSAAWENKKRWHGCLTYVRATPELLANGWDGHSAPANGYTHLDYGWLQYNAGERKDSLTILASITAQEALLSGLHIGLALSMNMANAGLRTDLDGVTACWDYDNNPNTTVKGVVIGTPANGAYTEAQRVPCAQLPPTTQNLMVNPAWIKRIAQVAKNDHDIPFLLYWNYPDPSAGSDLLQGYVFRADFVSAFTYAINQGAARTTFNGYRAPKCPC